VNTNKFLTDLFIQRITFRNENVTYRASLAVSFFNKTTEFEALNILREEEKEQLLAYDYQKRKESYYGGRVSGKIAVSDFTKLKFQEFQIDNGVFNQPVIQCLTKKNCQVSISHANHASASIAFDEKHPLGIDIESVDQKNSITIVEYLTVGEKAFCVNDNIPLIFWTAKEALSKVLKTGLTIPLHLLEIKSFRIVDSFYVITFVNFAQYKVISFFFQDTILSIAYPSTSQLNSSNLIFSDFHQIDLKASVNHGETLVCVNAENRI